MSILVVIYGIWIAYEMRKPKPKERVIAKAIENHSEDLKKIVDKWRNEFYINDPYPPSEFHYPKLKGCRMPSLTVREEELFKDLLDNHIPKELIGIRDLWKELKKDCQIYGKAWSQLLSDIGKECEIEIGMKIGRYNRKGEISSHLPEYIYLSILNRAKGYEPPKIEWNPSDNEIWASGFMITIGGERELEACKRALEWLSRSERFMERAKHLWKTYDELENKSKELELMLGSLANYPILPMGDCRKIGV